MTYEMYHSVFIGAAICCGIMLAVTIVLFFWLKIPKLIGNLSGITARKAIESIRKQNEHSEEKMEVLRQVKKTAALHPTYPETMLLNRQSLNQTLVLSQSKNPFNVEYEICFIHSDEIIG